MFAYATEADGEVAGLLVGRLEDEEVTITEVVLLPQTASAASVELDEKGMAEYMAANPTKLVIGWWHSHVDMKCFMSGTDDKTNETMCDGAGYCISIVCNKSGDFKAKVYCRAKTFPIQMVDDVELICVMSTKDLEAVKKEVAEKVKPAQQYYYNQGVYNPAMGGIVHEAHGEHKGSKKHWWVKKGDDWVPEEEAEDTKKDDDVSKNMRDIPGYQDYCT